jgi:hypothetical protein
VCGGGGGACVRARGYNAWGAISDVNFEESVVSGYLPVKSSLIMSDCQRDQNKDRQSMEPGNDWNVF